MEKGVNFVVIAKPFLNFTAFFLEIAVGSKVITFNQV